MPYFNLVEDMDEAVLAAEIVSSLYISLYLPISPYISLYLLLTWAAGGSCQQVSMDSEEATQRRSGCSEGDSSRCTMPRPLQSSVDGGAAPPRSGVVQTVPSRPPLRTLVLGGEMPSDIARYMEMQGDVGP